MNPNLLIAGRLNNNQINKREEAVYDVNMI